MYGQKTAGVIRGSVTDPSGAVVANASITVTNTATGASRTATTSTAGEYAVPDLDPGVYQVTIKAPNFKETVVNNVELHVSSTALVNAKLELGGATEVMEVSANALQVQTDSAALGEVIESGQVKELPLNGRSFVQLTQLAPGVSGANNFDSKNKGLQSGVDFSVNGNPTTNNLFLIDGANNNDVGSNRTILLYPSIEAIAEFKMLRNSYSAEYGQASGAVIHLVTKGGSNDFHGSAFYNGRNSALNSYEYFAAQAQKADPSGKHKDALQRNDFGGSIGGPIKKDRIFFFYSEEFNREKRGYTRTSCVPTQAERDGDFTSVSCSATSPNFSNLPANLVIGNPATSKQLASVDPAGALLIAKYPLPNTTLPNGDNWAMSEPGVVHFREENVRGDINLTKKNSLMMRYTQDTWTNPAPTAGIYWGDDIFPGLTSNWAQPSKMAIAKVTSQIGSTMVNDAEFSYSNNRINITVGGTNPGLQQQISDAIPPLWPQSLKQATASIPTIWGGFGAYGHGQNYWVIAPWTNSLDIYSFRDDFSKVAGNHTLKFGALFDWSGKNEINSASSSERPTFGTADWDTNHPTGNNLANVLVPGAVWGFAEPSTNLEDHLRWRDHEFYVDDTWKVRRNLTLQLGLRWSMLLTPFNPDDQATSFQPSLWDPNKPASDACNGLWTVPGTDPCGAANQKFGTAFSKAANGPNKYLVDQNYHLFAPRIGVAWDPWGDGNWAIRAGIGQFFQRERVSGPYYSITNNAPFVINANASKALTDPTPATLSGSASPGGGRDPSSNTPNAWQWNFSVEHSFAKETVLQLGYVGNRGIHLTSNIDVNAIQPGTTATCGGITTTAWTCAAFLSGGAQNAYRPYAVVSRGSNNFGELNYWMHGGDSSYHALQALFKTRYKRSQLTAAYTWAHSISDVQLDDSSGGAGSGNFTVPSNPSLDRGNSPINRPHIFAANFYYYLPDLNNSSAITRSVLGGWEVASIITVASGNSHTVYQNGVSENSAFLAPGQSGSGLQAQFGNGGRNDPLRPLLTGESCTAGRDGNHLYNQNAFTMVGYVIGTYPGNVEPRGFCPGPSLQNIDFSVDKNWKLTERLKMQFRLDFFNLFNHANFRGDQVQGYTPAQNINCGPVVGQDAGGNSLYNACSPTNNVITKQYNTSNFGDSTQTTTKAGREIQYGLRFTF